MALDRIAQLKEFVNEDPMDPFNHYALALEYVNSGNLREAYTGFAHLLAYHPSYLPCYYHFGKLLENIGEMEEAKRIFTLGIALAIQQGANKTAAELKSALDLVD